MPGTGLACGSCHYEPRALTDARDFGASRWSDLAEGTAGGISSLGGLFCSSGAGTRGDEQSALTRLPEIVLLPPSVGLMMGSEGGAHPPPRLRDLELCGVSLFCSGNFSNSVTKRYTV